MRISDWSSDVCSSDLTRLDASRRVAVARAVAGKARHVAADQIDARDLRPVAVRVGGLLYANPEGHPHIRFKYCESLRPEMTATPGRSEERRVGKEGVRPVRSRGSPFH